ncbi:CPBP family intramembrane metalloprotease [Allokutzneria sp. A3M-2-11 16]|uniref:CPBP family intramembrane glutamic endopeptidase n=1 Tax=Allokutzneria sp. A3M-2-11 16 TaxID=2962043 RepID=UPI0020B82FCA|nr:CPBP family intramembrane glutamic endopeptidase [Allokutzneria sp. A3M-2-11 16]MCP3798002.1 CPBP family intramembrane metalloprotease [Allokutzneria sp. A3M-2-11 16]
MEDQRQDTGGTDDPVEAATPPMGVPQQPQPSWAAYGTPMRGVEDGRDTKLHTRFWEAEQVASARGSLQWGFLAFFIGFGGFYLLSLLISVLMAGQLRGFDPADPPKLGPLLLLAFVPNLLLGLGPVVVSWMRGRGPVADYGFRPTLRDVRVGVLCGLAALVPAWIIAFVLIRNSPDGGPQGPVAGLPVFSEGQTVWLAIFVLFIAVGAPITEELLVRGALWGALEHFRVPRYAILILTTMMFAFIHQEPDRMPLLFAAGLLLGTARMITGRIGASIVAHAVYNLLPAIVLFFAAG